jgi:hypothetical protein
MDGLDPSNPFSGCVLTPVVLTLLAPTEHPHTRTHTHTHAQTPRRVDPGSMSLLEFHGRPSVTPPYLRCTNATSHLGVVPGIQEELELAQGALVRAVRT